MTVLLAKNPVTNPASFPVTSSTTVFVDDNYASTASSAAERNATIPPQFLNAMPAGEGRWIIVDENWW